MPRVREHFAIPFNLHSSNTLVNEQHLTFKFLTTIVKEQERIKNRNPNVEHFKSRFNSRNVAVTAHR